MSVSIVTQTSVRTESGEDFSRWQGETSAVIAGWREALEASWTPGTTMAFHVYIFSHNEDGSPGLCFMQNRIHARNGYIWRYPAHEGLYPYGIEHKLTVIPQVVIEQFQTPKPDRGAVLEALAWGVAEHPDDPRMAHYYGRELMYRKRFAEAIEHLERYTRIKHDFYHEKAENATCLAQCYKALEHGGG